MLFTVKNTKEVDISKLNVTYTFLKETNNFPDPIAEAVH